MENAKYFEAEAGVRYWEDARVNGIEDDDGSRIPCRVGDAWCPTIELATGQIVGWPSGATADIHYKVCDDGRYWLLDADGKRIAERDGYVPSAFLCHGDNGYGDYIILTIGPDGRIADYESPDIRSEEWRELPALDVVAHST
jgi:hypothetical protein